MSKRSTYALGLLIITAILAASLYIQFYEGFNPCPLCSLQRICFIGLGILFLIGIIIHRNRVGRIITNLLLVIVATAGILFSGRQVYLQYFPAETSGECGASLEYMMKVLPVNEVIQKTLEGSAECTERSWELLHISMAEWSLICFFLLFIASGFIFFEEFLRKRI